MWAVDCITVEGQGSCSRVGPLFFCRSAERASSGLPDRLTFATYSLFWEPGQASGRLGPGSTEQVRRACFGMAWVGFGERVSGMAWIRFGHGVGGPVQLRQGFSLALTVSQGAKTLSSRCRFERQE